jgi:hypothetical protein
MGFVESLFKQAGLDWPVPDYNTVCRRQKVLPVGIHACPNRAGQGCFPDSDKQHPLLADVAKGKIEQFQ